jgi:hypothetical protein
MTAPALLFSLLVASVAAAAYHILFGQSLRQLPAFWLASVVGFGVGQVVAGVFALNVPHLGSVHLIEGLALGIVLMTVVRAIRL